MTQPDPQPIGRLQQKVHWTRTEAFALYPDRLEFEVFSFWSRGRDSVPLTAIKSDLDLAKRTRTWRTVVGAGALVLLLASAAAAIGMHTGDVAGHIPDLAVAAGIAILSWIAVAGLWEVLGLPARNWILLYDPQGKPALVVAADDPAPAQVEAFLKDVAAARERAFEHLEARNMDGLPRVGRELERIKVLADRGVLTAEEFAQVKAKLLGLEKPRLGFGPRGRPRP